jgi:hypothetical protein
MKMSQPAGGGWVIKLHVRPGRINDTEICETCTGDLPDLFALLLFPCVLMDRTHLVRFVSIALVPIRRHIAASSCIVDICGVVFAGVFWSVWAFVSAALLLAYLRCTSETSLWLAKAARPSDIVACLPC